MKTDHTKSRLKDILTSPEATGRKGLAHHLAFETDLDLETCRKILVASPQEPQQVLDKAIEKQNAKVVQFSPKSRGDRP